ncbi:MAG: CotH kinase family protein, partial [Phycisphaeraceae bacterium]|nr:CotH kinase family protein [Phycisphaeraceae bacterium]
MKRTIAIIILSLLWPVLSTFAGDGVGDPLTWITISEFSAVNDKGLSTFVEGLETRSDWIEIHNAARESINLDGWYLTDDPENLTLWAFPEIHIGPQQTVIVWASGIQAEDHPENWPYVDDLGDYHTNFRLSRDGDYLALISPDLQVVHEYASHSITKDLWGYPPQKEGVSYGLCAGEQTFLPWPTPGQINASECLDQCQAPVFSRVGGTFADSFILELSSPTPNAEIFYQMDGAEPVEPGSGRRSISWTPHAEPNEWTKYVGPIEIDRSVEVLAHAQEPTMLPSATVNQSYLALSSDVTSFSSNLPIIIVDTGGTSVSGGAFKLVKAAFIEPNESGRAHMTDAADFVGRGGLHIRGSSSSGFAKKQYAFETWDLDEEDDDVSILGFPAESDWILYGPSQYDLAIISNAFIYELSNQAGRYAPRTRFCEMYLNSDDGTITTNDYIGIYIFMEKINRDSERVAVEKLEPWDSTEPQVSGGYVLSIDRAGDGSFSANGNTFIHVYPKGEDLTDAQANWIRGYINELGAALNGPDFASPTTGYAQYIDVNSFIDHNILNLLPLNVDAFRLSGYMHKKRGGKLELGPIWDFDRAMNSTDGRDDNPEQWNNFLTYYWWDRLFDDPHFWVQYIDRWFEFRNTVFSIDHMNAVIDRMVEEIGEAQVRNRNRWPQYSPRYGGFDGEIAALKDWLYRRATWIDHEFVRPPVF